MYASHIEIRKKEMRRTSLIFLCISLFCGLFSAVYEHFSFGVYSNFMVYLFMFPLVGGTVPFAVFGLMPRVPCPSPASARLYNSGIAALTVGSCVKGALDIYGTGSVYIPVYWAVGIMLSAAGLVLYAAGIKKQRGRA